MRLVVPLAASALVALLAACNPCNQNAKVAASTPVAQVLSPDLQAEYLPQDDGTFQAVVRVTSGALGSGGCLELDPAAQADVGGVALAQPPRPDGSCACRTAMFVGQGPIPAATDGTFTVRDATGDLSVTVPSLFVPATVALQDQAGGALSALPRSSRVYLVFAPANFVGMAAITVAFTAAGAAQPAFSLTSTPGGGVAQDGTRWYFEVPATAPTGGGVLAVTTNAMLDKTSCTATASTGTVGCNVVSLATRRLSTTVQ